MRIYAYNIINKVGKDAIIMRETRILEFKETITNTFLKTVSAFSNYDGGTILFGVDDDGNMTNIDFLNQCIDCWLIMNKYTPCPLILVTLFIYIINNIIN